MPSTTLAHLTPARFNIFAESLIAQFILVSTTPLTRAIFIIHAYIIGPPNVCPPPLGLSSSYAPVWQGKAVFEKCVGRYLEEEKKRKKNEKNKQKKPINCTTLYNPLNLELKMSD